MLLLEKTGRTVAAPLNDKTLPNILIIDNEHAIVEMMTMLLEDEYNVTTCTDSSDAVNQASQLVPEVIILDIMMPYPDGIEVLRLLRKNSATSAIPVILMTAGLNYCGLSESELKELKAWLISKPFDNMQLMELIEQLLSFASLY